MLIAIFAVLFYMLPALAQTPSSPSEDSYLAEGAEIFKSPSADIPSKPAIMDSAANASSGISVMDFVPGTPLAAAEPAKKPASARKNLGILDLEEHLSADRFEKNNSIENKSILVRVYEDMALALCFPSLSAILAGTPNKTDSNCEEVLNKIEAIHSNNTILICARKGIDSVECAQSFEKQSTRKVSKSDAGKFTLIENTKDIAASSASYDKLQKKLITEVDKYKATASTENLKSLESASFSMLALICADHALELRTAKEKLLAEEVSKNSISSIAESIKSLEEDLTPVNPRPTISTQEVTPENQNMLFRTRILSERCYDTLVDLIAIDSRLPSPVCFRDSFIAPSCLSALRRFRNIKDQLLPGQIAPTATPRDSLASF